MPFFMGDVMSHESNVKFLEWCEEKDDGDWNVDNMATIMSLRPVQCGSLCVDDMFDCDGLWRPRRHDQLCEDDYGR